MSYNQIPEGASLKIEPFKLNIDQSKVDHFYQLLKLSPLAPLTFENNQATPPAGISHYGVTMDWMKKTKEHWESKYDWKKREKRINDIPQYTTDVKDDDGYVFKIHFAALFSQKQDAIPIVWLHGWPGDYLEFLGLMRLVRDKYPADQLPYHIIVPSLPGYALSSGPPADKNFDTEGIARIVDKLMVGLGAEQSSINGYVAQGGDVGSYACRPLSLHRACKAVHLNFGLMRHPEGTSPTGSTEIEAKGVERFNAFASDGSAYAYFHGSRPATVGFVLSSSPVAQLAWIGDKFLCWTDPNTRPSTDDILDSITLYWFTQSLARCIYPYREFYSKNEVDYIVHSDPKYHIKQPLGYSYFPMELSPIPVEWVATTGNMVWSKSHESGGHFAAFERPETLLQDVEEFVEKVFGKK
ncbi:hypothetical protein H2200_012799 [Cladophialophora chaetospira]|uniref:Epoxide hydrolase N-terminal domain-containing protein n=1 Tax=Cladophialophora chaetospira TaxID=386627 RepID=A0AA38WWT9_9EURO|nr:hypothetical protein H2200_012799 [Cladophialophora chaetospira]